MLVWVLWQVKTVTCPWMGHVCDNHTSGVKPHNRSSYPETYGKLMPCEVSNDKEIMWDETLKQDLEVVTLSSQSDQQVAQGPGQESNWVGIL